MTYTKKKTLNCDLCLYGPFGKNIYSYYRGAFGLSKLVLLVAVTYSSNTSVVTRIKYPWRVSKLN